MRNSRIYYFVGGVDAQTDDLLTVLHDLFAQIVPPSVIEPMFAPDEEGKPLHQRIDEGGASAEVPLELLQAVCSAVQREWPYSKTVYAFMNAWTDARVEGMGEDAVVIPVRRLAEVILAGPADVDLDVLPPLIETVLQVYGDTAVVEASRGEVQAWDLGNGWKFVTDVRSPKRGYGVEKNG